MGWSLIENNLMSILCLNLHSYHSFLTVFLALMSEAALIEKLDFVRFAPAYVSLACLMSLRVPGGFL